MLHHKSGLHRGPNHHGLRITLSFWLKISALIYDFTQTLVSHVKRQHCPHGNQPSVRLSANVLNKDVRALKEALENLNTRKSISRRILWAFCRKF